MDALNGIGPASRPMVEEYLARIGVAGEVRPDLPTLIELHRRHVETIAWENFDVLLGRRLTRDPHDAFEKIVRRGRGGWCYEMNGLFAWILEAVGFRLTRLAGAVMREQLGDEAIGNHLVLLVHLDRTYVADVGLGSGLIEPVPFEEGEIRQGFRAYSLERLDGGWWRFRNQPDVDPPSFDFSPDVTDEALLEDRSNWLQTDPGSPFTRTAVVQRYFPDRLESLISASAVRIDADGQHRMPITEGAAYVLCLKRTFGISLSEAETLWSKISSQPASFA